MLIYLASPYTYSGPNPIVNKKKEYYRYKAIQAITAKLMNKGFVVFSPIVYGHNLAQDCKLPTDWNYWRTILETMIPRYDELWVVKMDDWYKSKGVEAEIHIAENNRIPVVYIEMNDPRIL